VAQPAAAPPRWRVRITPRRSRVSRRALESELRRLEALTALRDLEDELDELEPPRPRESK
jgi:hypothetical protein